ncbi:MAG: ABC transporter permease [Candidatus Hodarchaeales archaeon]|jgi:ABC-type transport system involved in multi-copper enzyme maturation permease subunit
MSAMTHDIRAINAIACKNLKIKLRNTQTYLYSLGFPLLFTVLFYFMFKPMTVSNGMNVFDLATSGMLIYAASFGTINAATSLTTEKDRLTLIRLDTTPVGRTKIFIGTLLSESVFLIAQLVLMFVISYGLLGAQWYQRNLALLVIGFIIIFIFGLSTLGMGIIISAYAKSANSAVGLSMMYVMPILFLSGSMIPFESPIVYLCPPFWANQIYQQVVILGDNILSDGLRINAYNIFEAGFSSLPLWGSFIIIFAILISTLLIGIKLFQKKTLN